MSVMPVFISKIFNGIKTITRTIKRPKSVTLEVPLVCAIESIIEMSFASWTAVICRREMVYVFW